MYRDFVAMKKGDISQEQFEAKVMNYAKQVSADMPVDLSKNFIFSNNSGGSKNQSHVERDAQQDSVGTEASFGMSAAAPTRKGSGSVGPSASATGKFSSNYSETEENVTQISNTTGTNSSKGGRVSQDMLAVQIKNEMISNMEDLYKNGGMTKDGAGIGTQLSNELSSFVGGKANKPF